MHTSGRKVVCAECMTIIYFTLRVRNRRTEQTNQWRVSQTAQIFFIQNQNEIVCSTSPYNNKENISPPLVCMSPRPQAMKAVDFAFEIRELRAAAKSALTARLSSKSSSRLQAILQT